MDQQQTIFNEAFYADTPTRRRKVVPKAVNIYAWVAMLMGVVFALKLCYGLFVSHPAELADTLQSPTVAIGAFLMLTIPFFMGFLVWIEAKHAIKFNWIAAGLFCFLLLSCLGMGTIPIVTMGIFIALFAPYWIMLFINQRKWEKKAVRGKQYKIIRA